MIRVISGMLACLFLTVAADSVSGDGISSAVSRFDPVNYTAGQPVVVTILVTPADQTSAYAVEDAPPSGWTISAISDLGNFDSVNGKVKWGPYFDATIRSLSYTMTPPVDASGEQTLAGTASFDGNGIAISGDRTLQGRAEASSAVSSFDRATYTPEQPVVVTILVKPSISTETYAIEDAPPSGWTITAISDSGSLDSGNGKVKWGPYFDATVRSLSYTMTPPVDASGEQTLVGTASFDGNGIAISGDRTLQGGVEVSSAVSSFDPATYTPEQPVVVTILVTPAFSTETYAVEDAPPSDWTITAISDSGNFDSGNGKVKWGPFFDATVRNLSYTMTPPVDASGEQTLVGTASFDGNGIPISGDRIIQRVVEPIIFIDGFESDLN